MNGDLVSVLLWGFLAILTMFLAEVFGYVFYKDRDSRKLMFMLAFAFASLSYLPKMQTGLESIQIMENLWRWGSLPLVSAILIAVLSSLLRIEDFDNLYKAFLFTIAISIFLIVVPLSVNFLLPLIFQGMSMVVIVVSIYLILTRRKISDLMFLLSILCFTLGGLGMGVDLAIEFTVFAFVFAYVFIALVFATSEESVKGGMASFFALRRKLEKTQEERKRAEEALRESEKKFRAISTSAEDAILLMDNEGEISYWNPAAERIFGFTKEEAIGKELHKFLAPKRFYEDYSRGFEKFTETGQGSAVGKTLELVALRKDGTEFTIELSLSALQMKGKWYATGIVRDITERKHMQKKLEEYSQQLEELVEKRTRQLKKTQEQLLKSERLAAIGEVAAMVGHDLRNPLTGIAGATYYLKMKFGPKMDKKTKEMLELIEKDVEHSNNIISDLLAYSREIRLELAETTPKSILKDALILVKVPKNIQILDLTENEPKIEIDAQKMKRVFVNIIKNAVDAMPEGGKLTITSKESHGNLEIAFTDTGTGIPKDIVEEIWTPLFTTKPKGMGLGLPICKRIVEAHRGLISVESTVGKGAAFTVMLPIKPKIEGGEKTWVNVPESLLLTTTKA